MASNKAWIQLFSATAYFSGALTGNQNTDLFKGYFKFLQLFVHSCR